MPNRKSSRPNHTELPESIAKQVPFAPALIFASLQDSVSISELVMTYRLSGLGGERACRKLIHRLERMQLLQIDAGAREDRREKAVRLTSRSRELLGGLRKHLEDMGY